MQRRTLFKWGLAGGAVLALGGGLAALTRPGWVAGKLAPAGRELFTAVAIAVLEGVLPAPGPARDSALAAHLSRVEATVNGMPARTQAEIAQLLGLLGNPAGRRGITGLSSAWGGASVAEVQAALQSMRESGLTLRQQVYSALRDITSGAYFSHPSTWAAVGYPGPIEI